MRNKDAKIGVVEEGDTICDVECFLDTDESDYEGHEDGSESEPNSIVFGMDSDDAGIMGKIFVKGSEDAGYDPAEVRGKKVICELLVYEEEGWKEKYGTSEPGQEEEEEEALGGEEETTIK